MSTMWPWSRHNRAVEEARQGLKKAATEAVQAEWRRDQSERLATHSRQVSERLRKQVELNNFTELFIQAMGPRR